ncbi:MAG: hypothetical protein FJ004_05990 [Chloroflexi bacterium]|nr:hypothetical protein [Chloroflexota bacterium]
MEPWIGVVGIVIGVMLSEVVRWLRDRGEKQEKYRVMLYEKRLEIHQQAFTWLRKLAAVTMASDTEKREVISKVDEWWNSNCLYLDDESREAMLDAISGVEGLIDLSPPQAEVKRTARLALEKALSSVMHGIGMKHLDKAIKIKSETQS